MMVNMQADLAFQIVNSNQPKQPSSSSDNVRDPSSFRFELQKQINGTKDNTKKEVKKSKEAPVQKQEDDEDESKAAKVSDAAEVKDAPVSVVPQQPIQGGIIPAVLPVTVAPQQGAEKSEAAASVQGLPGQAIAQIQHAWELVEQAVVAVPNTTANPQQAAAEQQAFASVLHQEKSQGNPVQPVVAQPDAGSTQSNTAQNGGTQTANQPAAQPVTAAPVAPMAEKNVLQDDGEKDQAQQITQYLSSFNEKLQNLGLALKTEAAASAPPMPTAEAKPFEQVASGILNAYSDGKMEFTMKLKPEMLGELTVKMVMTDGKLTMDIITGNQQTAKLIESQIPELRASLKENNVNMQSCTVENQSFNDMASSSNGFMSSMDKGGNQPYETRRVFFAHPVLSDASSDAVVSGIVDGRYVRQSMLNCYV